LLDDDEVREIVEPFKDLHFLRSKISGHTSEKEAKQIKAGVLKQQKTFPFHFRQLSKQFDKAVRSLQSILEPRISQEPLASVDG
jgi:hypothetical protein